MKTKLPLHLLKFLSWRKDISYGANDNSSILEYKRNM